ncbi:MAG: hypothetical protein UHK44_10080 [Bacteroidaceae bacterium]|nr:hypothetical protein [Bacteroidaceae bacterium]
MAKAKTYLAKIRKQVKADHNGTIPENLELTIENYAVTLEMRDVYRDEVMKNPTVVEIGSMGQQTTKQNPLCNLLYQQEGLCQQYAKMLGLTAAKAAMKTEAPDSVTDDDPMAKYYRKQ